MSEFIQSWRLSRQRFNDSVKGLSGEQLNWKLHPAALSIGQCALHVAGVEVWFISQLKGDMLDVDMARLAKAATEGVVNDHPFPFADSEITPELVHQALETAYHHVEPVIVSPSPEHFAVEIKSALGPIITGEGAFARLAFHPAYHHGQVYLIATAPGFPA